MTAIARGNPSIGMTAVRAPEPTLPLPDYPQTSESIIQDIAQKLAALEIIVERKANSDSIRSLVAISDEAILIQAKDVVIAGQVTFVDLLKDWNGVGGGAVSPGITRIRGGVIQTGVITSNNWSATAGTAFDLDNGIVTIGGSLNPSLYFEAGNLFVSGSITTGSVIADTVTVNGTQIGVIRDNANTGASHAGSGGNPHGTQLTQIAGDLDDISDGSTFFRSTATQNIGGTRAANALDASFDYIRAISTQKIAVSGTNPTSGIVIDNTGLRGYAASALKFNISTSGDAWFAGDITAGAVIAGTVTADGSPVSTIKNNAATGAGHAGTGGNPHGTTLTQISGDLDDIADGSTYFRSTATQNVGGSRAASALDASADYIRAISTQKIVVSGTNPTNGVVFDSAGLRGYAGGVLTFNVNTSGTAFFKGDITGATGIFGGDLISGGQIKATGSTPGGGAYGNFSIIAQPSGPTVEGILADATAVAIRGFSSSDTGMVGISNSLSHYGVVAANNNGGYGISVQATRGIQRTKNLTGKLTVWDTATNTNQGEFWYEFHV